MFDLEREVTAWSRAAAAGPCRNAATVDELRDHLHCEIERARAGGLSDEAAFRDAVEKMGSGEALAAELGKNRTVLGTACAIARSGEPRGITGAQRRLLMAHGLLWAVVVIVAAILLPKGPGRETFGWMLTVLFFPMWFASEQLLRRSFRSHASGTPR
jgi:type IV secretory pathway TrbD component